MVCQKDGTSQPMQKDGEFQLEKIGTENWTTFICFQRYHLSWLSVL